MNKQIIINVVKYDVRDKLESDNIRFRCHIMHNPCKAKQRKNKKNSHPKKHTSIRHAKNLFFSIFFARFSD